jgi:uncharacterized membrane protein YeaQ/YmgE (transglycosylase-associated protein family)
MPESSAPAGNLWMIFSLLSVACWGLYGVFLHSGQGAMGDPENGRYKAFFWVGIAYVLIAVLAPAGILLAKKASWSMPSNGILLSLVAGSLGALGALGVLLAFGAKGHPAVVMSIIFAGAPMVNAFVVFLWHPPAGGLSSLRWQFYLGIVLAAVGATMVTLFKPAPGPPPKAASSQMQSSDAR